MSAEGDKILSDAIEILERDGWHQGGYYKGDDIALVDDEAVRTAPVCAMGAINRAAFGEANEENQENARWHEASTRLSNVVESMTGHRVVPRWNDEKGRTKEDVLLAFKKALHED